MYTCYRKVIIVLTFVDIDRVPSISSDICANPETSVTTIRSTKYLIDHLQQDLDKGGLKFIDF